MTLANNYAPIRQLGNGATTQFSAAWQMISATYAIVQLEDATTHALTSVAQGVGANQYQIALTSSGWTVTMGTAPTSSQYINVSRSTSLDQTNPYRTSKGFQGEVEENSFDKLTAIVQENANTLSRNISVPLGDAATLVLPQATARALQYLTFDASGNVTTVAGQSNVSVSTAMTPVVQASTLAAALSLLGGAPKASPAFTVSATLNGSPLFDSIFVQKFTTSGTYTPTPGMVFAILECWAGGGGGGGVAGSSSVSNGAGGGQAGGYSRTKVTAAQIGASKVVTIGAAGAGGASGGNTGGTGGDTSVGTLCVAKGGQGGQGVSTSAGLGGFTSGAGTGDITAGGQAGGNGNGSNATVFYAIGGVGGCAPGVGVAGQTAPAAGSTVAGVNASGFAAGGSGGLSAFVSANASGGNAAPGLAVITEFISA